VRLNLGSDIQAIKSLWEYRKFILGMAEREFRARYLGSVLGCLWALINPLGMVLIYTTIFSRIMRARMPGIDDPLVYSFFLCVGIFSWIYFTEVVTRSQVIFIENANLMKKSQFPRICLPAVVLLSATINFSILFGLFLSVLAVTGRFPGWAILGFIPLLALQQAFAIGLGLLLGTLNVFFRDIGQAMGLILQLWFWLTPIVYPLTILGETAQNLILSWNPLAALVLAYQKIIISGAVPDWSHFGLHLVGAMLLLLVGYKVFQRLSGEMVDEL